MSPEVSDRQNLLCVGPIKLDRITREVTCNHQVIELTSREFNLLEYLIRSPGRVFTRTQILEHVWGYDFNPNTNVMDVCRERIRNLLDEVRRLSGIMRKLLLLSLADAGKMSLYLVEVDMSELLMEMLEDVEMLAPHLTVQTDFTHGLRLLGDRDLLIQVLQNLFSNAIKYNLTNGWIQIRAHQTPTTLHVTIANASKDIPLSDAYGARERDRIFDRFYRGEPARTRKVEGIGLGLGLAREIARAHHGDLTLDSTSFGQTAFTLSLPMKLHN